MEQRGTERRKGSTRVLTQAAVPSSRLLSAPQEIVIRTRGAGIMENLKVFQNNKNETEDPLIYKKLPTCFLLTADQVRNVAGFDVQQLHWWFFTS